MNEEEQARIVEVIRDTIEKKVNGKVDAISRKQDEQMAINLAHNVKHEEDMTEVRAHIKKMEPIMEAYTGVGALGSLMKWLSGVVVSAGVLWLAFKGVFPTK